MIPYNKIDMKSRYLENPIHNVNLSTPYRIRWVNVELKCQYLIPLVYDRDHHLKRTFCNGILFNSITFAPQSNNKNRENNLNLLSQLKPQ